DHLVDIGSGAGLPGIPLALIAADTGTPNQQFVLVDSNGKKARFLRAVVRELELKHVEVAESRVESVLGQFDCVTSRAFATLADMLGWGGHLLAPNGVWLALKGRVDSAEIDAIPAAFQLSSVQSLKVPGLDAERHAVIITHQATSNHPAQDGGSLASSPEQT
ncbi:MAG: 16S rRNA (guanine(527)-N(7))-methyltransferase RsmG, partial [Dokdonella sp.]